MSIPAVTAPQYLVELMEHSLAYGRTFMNLLSRKALLASAKSVTGAIIFVSFVTGTLAEEVKLDTESYMIPIGRSRHSALYPQQAPGRDHEFYS